MPQPVTPANDEATATAPSAPELRVTLGPDSGRTVRLEPPRLVIGRGDAVDLPLADTKTSREHVEVRLHDGAWLVADLGSRNGTLLNGVKLTEPVALKPGDRIHLGLTEIEFVAAPGRAATRLRVIEGAEPGAELVLGPTRSVIGRAGERAENGAAALVIDDIKASRENSEIVCVDGVYRLRDLDSRNGTMLNGDRLVAPLALHSGDQLRVGGSVLEFVDSRVEDLVGSSIASLQLVARLGSGSVGVVYRASAHAGGAPAALKLLDPAVAHDAPAVARFLNNARLLRRVEHRNLLRILWAELVDQQPAVAMPLMHRSLASRLAGGPLTGAAALALAQSVAHGLAAAAEHKLSHGGLRPNNILFAADGSAVVADLGLCAPYDHQQPVRSPPSNWIAPEELITIPAGVVAIGKADQFALGAILHQALSGLVPWTAPSRAATASARAKLDLPPLAECDEALAQLIARLLARAPDHRFAGWGEVLTALEQAARGEVADCPAAMRSALTPAPKTGTGSVRRAASPRRTSERTERIDLHEALSAQNFGVPAFAFKGIAILIVALIVAGVAMAVINQTSPPPAREPPTRPSGVFAPAIIDATKTPKGEPTAMSTDRASDDARPSAAPDRAPTPAVPVPGAPALNPRILAATWIGGPGDQRIHAVGFAEDGSVVATGAGFTVRYDQAGAGRIDGDASTIDAGKDASDGGTLVDARSGVTYQMSTAKVHPLLQQPLLTSSSGWRMWGWTYDQIITATTALPNGPLVADARGGDVWAMPKGRIGTRLWCSAANSTLGRDAHDLGATNGAVAVSWQHAAHGPSSLVLLIDASNGSALSGTFLPGDVADQAVDRWGRLYLPVALAKPGEPAPDPFRMRGRAGLSVLASDLRAPLFTATLGGLGASDPGSELLNHIALRGNLLVLGGATTATALNMVNAVQDHPGGGSDGLLVIIKLWE